MARLFGTDGVRGLANKTLTAELALSLARAAAQVLPPQDRRADGTRPTAVVGRDPRASGEMLEQAVCAGLTAAGVDAVRVGVLPTPAVAFLTAQLGASFGVMISASHNPMPDNGIKFFDGNGGKLADIVEDQIEAAMASPATPPTGADIGRVTDVTDALDRYIDHVVSTVSQDLSALTVVVDCAQGAAWAAAPSAYQKAGATVIAINASPTGLDINDGCGSTHLEQLQHAVRTHNADLGLAHDGDADRCLAVDAAGQVIDGDMIMAVLAVAMHERGELVDNTLVATVMSNLGLHIGMRSAGITVRTTAVGDRYVLEDLRAGGYSLGGEQSGHVVIPQAATTGDGILTGLALLDRMAHTGSPIAELASVMAVLPQVLINVPVADKSAVAQSVSVKQAVTDAEAELGDTGRVLLRPSGTEQLVRVMVEAPTQSAATAIATRIAHVVESAR